MLYSRFIQSFNCDSLAFCYQNGMATLLACRSSGNRRFQFLLEFVEMECEIGIIRSESVRCRTTRAGFFAFSPSVVSEKKSVVFFLLSRFTVSACKIHSARIIANGFLFRLLRGIYKYKLYFVCKSVPAREDDERTEEDSHSKISWRVNTNRRSSIKSVRRVRCEKKTNTHTNSKMWTCARCLFHTHKPLGCSLTQHTQEEHTYSQNIHTHTRTIRHMHITNTIVCGGILFRWNRSF